MRESFIYDEDKGIFWIESWKKICSNVQAGFTSRNLDYATFGNLAFHVQDDPENVVHNRKRLAELNGMPLNSITCAVQTHGSNIVEVQEDHRGAGAVSYTMSIPDTDGLITQLSDTMLTLFYADCVPIFYLDPDHHAIGVAHAGWRGTVQNIAGKMVKKFQKKYDSKLERLYVAIGPSIGPCCYQVDDHVFSAVQACLPQEWESVVTDDGPGHYRLDLKKMNRILLENAGILSANIEISQYCTSCHSHYFFSHRKEGSKAGRMAAFAVWKGEST